MRTPSLIKGVGDEQLSGQEILDTFFQTRCPNLLVDIYIYTKLKRIMI